MVDTRTAILDAAEARMRRGGYGSVSFRDVAADVGIKSASVHHHFPTKADLGEALTTRYVDAFMERLGDPADPRGPRAALDRVAGLFREALTEADAMCLCGMLGAESRGLPGPVSAAAGSFFRRVGDWLDRAVGERAALALAALEGGLLAAIATDEPDRFRLAVAELRALVPEARA